MGFVSENATEKFPMRWNKYFGINVRGILYERNDSYGNLNCSVWFLSISQRAHGGRTLISCWATNKNYWWD